VLTQLNRSIEAVIRSYRDAPGAQKAAQDGAAAAQRAYPRTQGQAITVRLLRELAASVRAVGSEFVVVLTEGQGKSARELEKAVGDPGISFVYLDDVLRPEDYERMHLRGDFHWNAAGHEVVAQTISRSLVQTRKLAPDACPGAAAQASGRAP
jgi:hypothetical protein